MGDNLLQMIENHELNDPLNVEKELINAIGARIRRTAEYMAIGRARMFIPLSEVDLLEPDYNGARTFLMALGFVCINISSVTEELAAAHEFVRLIYPRVDEEIQARQIYNELQQFTKDKWIYKISRYLQACLTYRNLHMALGFYCSNMASVHPELAAAWELARLIYPTFREAIQASPM